MQLMSLAQAMQRPRNVSTKCVSLLLRASSFARLCANSHGAEVPHTSKGFIYRVLQAATYILNPCIAALLAVLSPPSLSPPHRRAGQFSWRVDLAAIRQLYDDVAAAGSRDSRILRSPAHSFAGYEVRSGWEGSAFGGGGKRRKATV